MHLKLNAIDPLTAYVYMQDLHVNHSNFIVEES